MVSSIPAAKFKLKDRGVLKPGAYADIVIMDLENVTDNAEPLNPSIYPGGI
jgi:N-acyl-D-aspartate/D-glutamate deacylase